MKSRIGKSTEQGFSFTGTLLSVVAGAVLAALMATAVNEYLASRRVNRERGEMSEFFRSVKGLLTTDASCQALLAGRSFSPVGESALSLTAGFGENPRGPLQEGFKFAKGQMVIKSFTLADKGIPPVSFEVRGQSVTRYMARVKLTLQSADAAATGASEYRPRFFEFPVLVDSASHVIRGCNNEFNISDACEALGFRWEASTETCQPKTSCLAGGTYVVAPGGLFGDAGCKIANPATHGCSCPAGFNDVPAGTVDVAQHCGRYCFSTFRTVHECYRCPDATSTAASGP